MRLKSTTTLRGNYVAFIISMLDLMKEQHYIAYVTSYKDDYALLDGLMELFLVFRELIQGNIYPRDWVSMKMIQNNFILGSLRYFCDFALCDRFLVGISVIIQKKHYYHRITDPSTYLPFQLPKMIFLNPHQA